MYCSIILDYKRISIFPDYTYPSTRFRHKIKETFFQNIQIEQDEIYA